MDISSGSLENRDVSASSFFSSLYMVHISKPCEIGICSDYGMENRLFLAMFSPVAFGSDKNPLNTIIHI